MSVALVKIQVRNDLAQQWAIANPILSDGEPGAESDTGRLKIGNGIDRWLDLPYVGGGSGGGSNPLTGIIDGGVFTGSPSNIQCSAPSNPAASKIVHEGDEKVAISWGAAYPYKPDTTVILRYTVEVTQNPSDATSWTTCCESWPTDDPSDPPNNYAISPVPEPQSSSASYWYRVKAVLSSNEDAEWGYTGEYRHFRSPVPTTFELDPEAQSLGSNSSTGDNKISIIVTGLSGDVQNPIEWSYPDIEGVSFTKDLGDKKLEIQNTQGADTPTQQLFVQCTINGVLRSSTINLSNTISDGPSPNPPADYLPVFEWELVEDEPSTEDLPGRNDQYYPEAPFLVVPEVGSSSQSVELGFCDVSRSKQFEFTDFKLLLQSPNCRPGPDNILAVNQFKQLDIGDECTAANMQQADGSPIQIANPSLTSVVNKEPDGSTQYQAKWSEYQVVDDVDLNGSKASYLLVQPSFLDQTVVEYEDIDIRTRDSTIPPTVTTVTQTNSASFLVCTKNGGTTFSLVDPRGTDTTYAIDTQAVKTSDNAFPMMMAKAVSVTGGREVLVAMYRFESGDQSVDQFYFTADHTNWSPCTNADRLPSDVHRIWFHDGVTYAVSPEHFGNSYQGKRSYYRSPKR